MNDKEFLTAFEDCTLPSKQWTHRAHVRVAYLYASQHNLELAIDRMRLGIKAYNKATDTPEAIDRGYHETITQAFMRLVFAANEQTGPHKSSEDFCDRHPELLEKRVLLNFYSRDRIMSWEAKAEFVEPDLRPLIIQGVNLDRGSDVPRNPRDAQANSCTLVEDLDDEQIPQLHALIQQQWWGGKRSLEDVRTMVSHTNLMIGLVENTENQLIGYCRVLTDFVFRATIYDVMVAEDWQGLGLGRRLMEALCSHPKLERVSFIYLCCEPKLFSFYERWGFSPYEGRTEWMIKVQREE